MFQILPVSGLTQAQGSLLQQQFGLIRQRQTLQPLVLQQPSVMQQSQVPVVITPPTPVDPPTFVFTQVAPSTVWTINHNLNTFPSVTTVDNAGNVIMGQVQYISSNEVVVTFTTPKSGSAYLNY